MNSLGNAMFSKIAIGVQMLGSLPSNFSVVNIKDVIDILIVSLLIYLVFIFIKQTRSYFIFNSFLFLLAVVYFSKSFNLSLTRQLFQPLLTFFIVIFVVVYQREIRRFFDWFSIGSKNLSLFRNITISSEVSSSIVTAIEQMSDEKTGAIIVIPGEYPLDDFIEGGYPINGEVTSTLLLSIFDTGSPGHDGAVLIQDNRIKMFGIHLPLAEDYKRYGEFGTRHRAAAGITEHSDALAIVVSEERGTISLAERGILTHILDAEDLQQKVRLFLKENVIETHKGVWHYFFFRNFLAKISSILLACLLWFLFVFQTGTVAQEYSVPVEVRYLPKEYVLQSTLPQVVSVRISGDNADLAAFDPRQLKVVVDGTSLIPGVNRVLLIDEDVQHPSYTDLVQITPETVTVDIGQAQ